MASDTKPHQSAPAVLAKRAVFTKLWNAGRRCEEIRRALGLSTPGAVSAYASYLRRTGAVLTKRTAGRGLGVHGNRGKNRPGDVGLALVAAAPAVILDAEGRPIAIMDPVTRRRKPIVPRAEEAPRGVARPSITV